MFVDLFVCWFFVVVNLFVYLSSTTVTKQTSSSGLIVMRARSNPVQNYCSRKISGKSESSSSFASRSSANGKAILDESGIEMGMEVGTNTNANTNTNLIAVNIL